MLMSLPETSSPWLKSLRGWLAGHPNAGHPRVPYPDYVTCPHCGEPEVEVWCYETTARCHNCGQTFDHPLPPGCGPDCQTCKGGPLL